MPEPLLKVNFPLLEKLTKSLDPEGKWTNYEVLTTGDIRNIDPKPGLITRNCLSYYKGENIELAVFFGVDPHVERLSLPVGVTVTEVYTPKLFESKYLGVVDSAILESILRRSQYSLNSKFESASSQPQIILKEGTFYSGNLAPYNSIRDLEIIMQTVIGSKKAFETALSRLVELLS